MWCVVVSRLVVSWLGLWCNVVWRFRVMCCLVLCCDVVSRLVVSWLGLWCNVVWRFRVMCCLVLCCDVVCCSESSRRVLAWLMV